MIFHEKVQKKRYCINANLDVKCELRIGNLPLNLQNTQKMSTVKCTFKEEE